jgi:hypothetical protein
MEVIRQSDEADVKIIACIQKITLEAEKTGNWNANALPAM